MIAALPLGAPAELDLLLRATLLIGAAWAAAAGLRRAGAPAAARHTAWLLGIAALLALPLLWWGAPDLRLPLLPAEAAPAAAGYAPPTAALPLDPEIALSPAAEAPGLRDLLLAVYALGAAALLLRLAVGRRLLARLWRDAEPARDRAWAVLLSRLSLEMQIARPVELRIATGPTMPMTWGTLAPRILLPDEASAWPPERRRLVLLHELAHVARRDSLSRSLAALACALYWFHPGAWFAARRLRIEQEHAADDRVLTAGGSAQAYARSLLHIAREIGGRLEPDLAATMAGMDQLERRLVSITGTARRDRPTPAFLSSSALLATLATLVVATGVPVSATPTRLGPLRPQSAAASLATRAQSAPVEDRDEAEAPGPARPEREGPAQAGTRDPLADPAAEGAIRSRPEGGASAAGAQTVPAGDRDPVQASAYSVPDYRWELRQSDSRARLESLTSPMQSARLIRPTPLSTPRERTGPPKWAQYVPKLVRPARSTGTPMPTADRTVMLYLSIDVGGASD